MNRKVTKKKSKDTGNPMALWTSDDYRRAARKSPIKVGDYVRVTRTAKTSEFGWANFWVGKSLTWSGGSVKSVTMDDAVDHVYRVLASDSGNGFELEALMWIYRFPFFVLKKVRAPKAAKA